MENLPPQVQDPNTPIDSNAPASKNALKFWIVVLIISIIGGLIWWYIGNMVAEPVVQQQPEINQEARQDAMIGTEINQTDLGDLDAEFRSVDQDMNSL